MSASSVRWLRRGAIAVAVLLIAGYAVGSLTGSGDRPAVTGGTAQREVSEGTGVTSATAPSDRAGGPSSIGALQLPAAPSNVIKTADLGLEVGKGRIDRVWDRVFEIASTYGGFVLASSQGTPQPIPVVEGDERILPLPEPSDGRFADIVIRVPAERFDAAFAALANGDLGKVTRRATSGQDVTQEFVDLESRLRHFRAQEAVMLRLMSRATSIGDTIAVQQQLSQVQLQIEEISGRLRYLRNQTEFGTISVHLAETGAVAGSTSEGPSFSKAWRTAVEGLERMGTAALIGAVWLSPFLVAALVWLIVRRRRTPPADRAPAQV